MINDAKVRASIKTPAGDHVEVPVKWSSGENIEFAGEYFPREEGIYLVDASAYSARGELLGKSEAAFFVETSRSEFSNAHLQRAFLQRIAEISGGKYYYQDEAKNLVDEVSVMKSSYSRLMEHDLWDMP